MGGAGCRCGGGGGGFRLGWHPVVGPAEGIRRTVAYLHRLRASGPAPTPAPLSRLAAAAAAGFFVCAAVALALAWLTGGPPSVSAAVLGSGAG